MKPKQNQNRSPAAGPDNERERSGNWPVVRLPLLRYIQMPTLALLLFLGVALLNTSVGKKAQTNEPAAGVSNTNVLSNSRHDSSPVAPLILWQFTKRIVEAFTAAVNDPSLIEYAKQQGVDTLNVQITPCRGAETAISMD